MLAELERVFRKTKLAMSLPKNRQLLIKAPKLAKVANLEVNAKSYWLYTNDPFDNRRAAGNQ